MTYCGNGWCQWAWWHYSFYYRLILTVVSNSSFCCPEILPSYSPSLGGTRLTLRVYLLGESWQDWAQCSFTAMPCLTQIQTSLMYTLLRHGMFFWHGVSLDQLFLVWHTSGCNTMHVCTAARLQGCTGMNIPRYVLPASWHLARSAEDKRVGSHSLYPAHSVWQFKLQSNHPLRETFRVSNEEHNRPLTQPFQPLRKELQMLLYL